MSFLSQKFEELKAALAAKLGGPEAVNVAHAIAHLAEVAVLKAVEALMPTLEQLIESAVEKAAAGVARQLDPTVPLASAPGPVTALLAATAPKP